MQLAELSADTSRAQNLNRPTMDLGAALQPDALASYLDHEYAEHMAACTASLERFERFLVVTKDGIADDHVTGVASDFVKQMKAEIAATKATHDTIKAPVLEAGRMIDKRQNEIIHPLTNAFGVVERRMAFYLQEKATAARIAAEQEAQRLAAAAHEAMREAESTPENTEAAIVALAEAQQAEALANAPTPELSRTRSLNGSMAGLKDNWVAELVDISKVPPDCLMVNDAIVKLKIKQGVREIPGFRIWNNAKAFVR